MGREIACNAGVSLAAGAIDLPRQLSGDGDKLPKFLKLETA
jgi:hypothetical protein